MMFRFPSLMGPGLYTSFCLFAIKSASYDFLSYHRRPLPFSYLQRFFHKLAFLDKKRSFFSVLVDQVLPLFCPSVSPPRGLLCQASPWRREQLGPPFRSHARLAQLPENRGGFVGGIRKKGLTEALLR